MQDPCSACRGTGKEICTVCRGRRKVVGHSATGADIEIKCKNCEGTGVQKCPQCNGVGRIGCQGHQKPSVAVVHR